MTMKFGIPIQIKDFRSDDDDWIVEGYASTFNNTDDGDDIVLPGAFDKTLKGGRRTAFLNSHDPRLVLGTTLEKRTDKKGLFAKHKISKTQLGKDTRELMMDGAMGGFSIGYRAAEVEWSRDEEIRRLKEIDLYEVSVVAMPMNVEAIITGVKDYWPGMTLAEKTGSLVSALEELLSDTRAVAQAGPGPLNQTKRQELAALLETLSGLDDARSDLAQILAAAPAVRPVEQYLIRQKLADYYEQMLEE